MPRSDRRILVVGGGPAGLMAAGTAAELGAEVMLLEKGPRTARKLRMTGKGRCNLTNTADLRQFIKAFGANGKFLYGPFSRYFRDETLAHLQRLGVPTKVERGGRVFPESDSAIEVAEAFEKWVAEAGVSVRTNSRAKGVRHHDAVVTGLDMFGGTIDGGAVIVAAGGASYPGTGSSGDGYLIARSAGHTIVQPHPALSAIKTREPWVRNLKGLALRNVEARLLQIAPNGDTVPIASEFGEMLFTHDGVSGPIILSLSRYVAPAMASGPLVIEIDLKPALAPDALHARFIREWSRTSHIHNYARELAPGSLADALPVLAGIAPDKPLNKVTAEERARLVDTLKGLRLSVRGLAPLDEAIVTAGGVPVREADPRTMMSRLVSGLYFAGEVLDLDAETGGYNLQAAFTTGWVAGAAAAAQVSAT